MMLDRVFGESALQLNRKLEAAAASGGCAPVCQWYSDASLPLPLPRPLPLPYLQARLLLCLPDVLPSPSHIAVHPCRLFSAANHRRA